MDSFLCLLRVIIQSQKNVAYILSGSVNSVDTIIEKIAGTKGAFGGRILSVNLNLFSKYTVYNYLNERVPSLKLSSKAFERFYQCTKGLTFYVNTFARFLPNNIFLNEDMVIKEFKNTLSFLGIHLINQWTRLNLKEKEILTYFINKPLKRNEIVNKLGQTTGSLSKPLSNLQPQELVESNNGTYKISEPILQSCLQIEYKNKGVFPFRTI